MYQSNPEYEWCATGSSIPESYYQTTPPLELLGALGHCWGWILGEGQEIDEEDCEGLRLRGILSMATSQMNYLRLANSQQAQTSPHPQASSHRNIHHIKSLKKPHISPPTRHIHTWKGDHKKNYNRTDNQPTV